MPKFVATPESVRAIEGNGNPQWLQAQGQRGLLIEVTRKGTKTWRAQGMLNGKQLRHTLGPVGLMCDWAEIEEMADAARKAVALMDTGVNPADAARRKERAQKIVEATVAEVWEKYQKSPKWKSRRDSTRTNYSSMWRKRLEPDLGALIMKDITPTAFLEFRQRWLENGGHGAARSTVMTWNGLWRFARSAALVPRDAVNPASDLTDLAPGWSAVGTRDDDIPDDRLGDFWWATYDLKPNVGAMLRFMLMTGLRSSEARLLTWDEIDTDDMVVKLPAERVKNRREFIVPLNTMAEDEIIDRMTFGHQRRYAQGDYVAQKDLIKHGMSRAEAKLMQFDWRRHNEYVFGDPKRLGPPDHPRNAVRRVCKLIELEPVVAHTLRHVHAKIARRAVGIAFVPALLNHTIGHVTEAVYAKMEADEFREKSQEVANFMWTEFIRREPIYIRNKAG